MLRIALRLALLIPIVSLFLSPLLLQILFRRSGNPEHIVQRSAWYSRIVLRILGFRINGSFQHIAMALQKPGLKILNHLSWVDPLVINSCSPVRFITSMEMRDTPFLGDICKGAGCVFIDRRSNRAAADESAALAEMIRKEPVVAFPEATSSCGDQVLPFKPAFFQSAIDAGIPIQALCLRYMAIDGRKIDPKNRDVVHWYGDMSFTPHFWRLLWVRRVDVLLTSLPSREYPGYERKLLAKTVHDNMQMVFIRVGKSRSMKERRSCAASRESQRSTLIG